MEVGWHLWFPVENVDPNPGSTFPFPVRCFAGARWQPPDSTKQWLTREVAWHKKEQYAIHRQDFPEENKHSNSWSYFLLRIYNKEDCKAAVTSENYYLLKKVTRGKKGQTSIHYLNCWPYHMYSNSKRTSLKYNYRIPHLGSGLTHQPTL